MIYLNVANLPVEFSEEQNPSYLIGYLIYNVCSIHHQFTRNLAMCDSG